MFSNNILYLSVIFSNLIKRNTSSRRTSYVRIHDIIHWRRGGGTRPEAWRSQSATRILDRRSVLRHPLGSAYSLVVLCSMYSVYVKAVYKTFVSSDSEAQAGNVGELRGGFVSIPRQRSMRTSRGKSPQQVILAL